MRGPGRRIAGGLVIATILLATIVARAEPRHDEPPCRWRAAAGLDRAIAPDPRLLDASPTRHRQLPLFREVMRQPLAAPCVAGGLLDDARRQFDSPHQLLRWAVGLAGVATLPQPAGTDEASERAGTTADPLAAALAWIQPIAERRGAVRPAALPERAQSTEPLRREVARMLAAMGRAHRRLERALERLPAELTPAVLRDQLLQTGDASMPPDALDLRALLPRLDREVLLAGMLELAAATERLQHFVTATPELPKVDWQVETPIGAVVVDTTGRDNTRRLAAPLLVLDVGGNDRYEFAAAPPARHISVVLDHGGNDRYLARADGADPSAATLGYGLLWDTDGDDQYQGTHFAQAAALFGAALLVDRAGANRFVATGHAQGYALGGLALLAGGPGNDEFVAQTHAQASAGPEGVAVLVDAAGNDRYTLDNEPLLRPSPQLPTHNTSMGQGAGRGLRPVVPGGLSATGGIGVLIDFAGDDRYTAQVFAQGAGYHEGLGLLIDGGGTDRFDAAWYAMGAAAHRAAGVLLKRGSGNDRYRAAHSTSLGAAHDLSAAVFLDEGGDDDYALGDLGFGASHDHGVAAFADLAGRDRYEVGAAACRAFGVIERSAPDLPGAGRAAGIFIDPDAAGDHAPGACRVPRRRR